MTPYSPQTPNFVQIQRARLSMVDGEAQLTDDDNGYVAIDSLILSDKHEGRMKFEQHACYLVGDGKEVQAVVHTIVSPTSNCYCSMTVMV
jgi:hypothetical protein